MKFIYKEISQIEPVTLSECKQHLGEVWDDNDDLITALITAARERAEEYTNRSLVDKTIELSLDGMPVTMYVKLPRGPLKEVVSVKYQDKDDAWQDVDDYTVDDRSEPARIYFSGHPALKDGKNTLRITYKTGYGDITSGEEVIRKNPLPNSIKQAILMSVRTMYDFRDDLVKGTTVARVSQNSEYLLEPYRIFEFL